MSGTCPPKKKKSIEIEKNVVVRKGELVKFIDLLTNDGETSIVVNYCITFLKYCGEQRDRRSCTFMVL